MAAGDLTFGTFKLCDISEGDRYSRDNYYTPPDLETMDVSFANTAGRELRIIGNQNKPESSLTVHYAHSAASTCMIVKSSEATAQAFITSVDTFRLNEDNLIGSLVDRDATLTGMRWVDWKVLTPIIPVQTKGAAKYIFFFEALFSRYTV